MQRATATATPQYHVYFLRNNWGEYHGRVYTAPMKPGNLQVYWLEGNILLDQSKRSAEGVPDYNALFSL